MAAADRRRIGLGPASKEKLMELAEEEYGSPARGGAPDWGEARERATHAFNSTVSLLNQVSDGGWEVLDLIADEADWKVTKSVLERLARSAHPSRGRYSCRSTL